MKRKRDDSEPVDLNHHAGYLAGKTALTKMFLGQEALYNDLNKTNSELSLVAILLKNGISTTTPIEDFGIADEENDEEEEELEKSIEDYAKENPKLKQLIDSIKDDKKGSVTRLEADQQSQSYKDGYTQGQTELFYEIMESAAFTDDLLKSANITDSALAERLHFLISKQNFNPNFRNSAGKTALHIIVDLIAKYNGPSSQATKLEMKKIDHKKSIENSAEKNLVNILFIILNELINLDVDLNLQDNNGDTIFHIARKNNIEDILIKNILQYEHERPILVKSKDDSGKEIQQEAIYVQQNASWSVSKGSKRLFSDGFSNCLALILIDSTTGNIGLYHDGSNELETIEKIINIGKEKMRFQGSQNENIRVEIAAATKIFLQNQEKDRSSLSAHGSETDKIDQQEEDMVKLKKDLSEKYSCTIKEMPFGAIIVNPNGKIDLFEDCPTEPERILANPIIQSLHSYSGPAKSTSLSSATKLETILEKQQHK